MVYAQNKGTTLYHTEIHHQCRVFSIFVQVQNVILSGTNTSEESRIKFHGRDAIQAKYLRIIPLANSYNTKDHPLRIELYGCIKLAFSLAGMSIFCSFIFLFFNLDSILMQILS